MPELCRFYNIVIKMIYSDTGQHQKPHFHVYYAEYEASVGVDGELLAGGALHCLEQGCKKHTVWKN